MARARSLPFQLVMPQVERGVMIDTTRGAIRIRKWPKKRSTPKSQAVRAQNAFFANARYMAKYVDPSQLDAATKLTKASGLYPNDVIMSAMMKGLYTFNRADGAVLKPFNWQLEACTMQGARIVKTSDQSCPASSLTPVVYQSALINDALLWSVAAPTRLTIPTGVERIIITAGFWSSVAFSGIHNTLIRKNGTLYVGASNWSGNSNTIATVTSGLLAVSPGDYFEAIYQPGVTNILHANQLNFISAAIVQAVA